MDCGRCIENCSYGVYRREGDKILIESRKCTACLRCVSMCPRDAITLTEKPVDYRSHPIWTREVREDIIKQARTGKIILSGMETSGICQLYMTVFSLTPARLQLQALTL